MFAQKIATLQDQIAQLQAQQQQYHSLDAETTNALALIAKIREQAAALGEVETVSQIFLEVLQPAATPAPQEPELEARVQQVIGTYQDECAISEAFGLEPPTTEELQKRVDAVMDSFPVQVEASLIEDAPADNLERYLDPEELQQTLNSDDPDLALMEIASLLDTSHQDDLEERVRYFIERLPSDMCDRLFQELCRTQGTFRARLEPKPWRETRNCHSVCHTFGSFGIAAINPIAAKVKLVHDGWCLGTDELA